MTAEAQAGFHRRCEGDVELFVRLMPKSSRNAIEGLATAADGSRHLKARVTAAPEKGRSNKALAGLLADAIGVSPGSVAVVAGATARLKTVRVTGDADKIEARLAALGEGPEPR